MKCVLYLAPFFFVFLVDCPLFCLKVELQSSLQVFASRTWDLLCKNKDIHPETCSTPQKHTISIISLCLRYCAINHGLKFSVPLSWGSNIQNLQWIWYKKDQCRHLMEKKCIVMISGPSSRTAMWMSFTTRAPNSLLEIITHKTVGWYWLLSVSFYVSSWKWGLTMVCQGFIG